MFMLIYIFLKFKKIYNVRKLKINFKIGVTKKSLKNPPTRQDIQLFLFHFQTKDLFKRSHKILIIIQSLKC